MTELQNPAIPEGIHLPYGSTEHISGRCLQCHKTFSKHSAIGAHCPLELGGFSSIFIWTPARMCRNAFANLIDFSKEPYVCRKAW